MTRLAPHARPRRRPDLAVRRIDDDVLLVPIRTDPAQAAGIYSLNLTAGLLWDALDGERSVEDLVALLVQRFEVEPEVARADVETLLMDLQAAGAVELP